MTTNLPHMIHLEQIAVDNDAPVFARAHIKQENVWKRQYQVEANHYVEQFLKN